MFEQEKKIAASLRGRFDQVGKLSTLMARLQVEKKELDGDEAERLAWINEQSDAWFYNASFKEIWRVSILDGDFTDKDVKDAIYGVTDAEDSDDHTSAFLFGDDHEYRDGDFQLFAARVSDSYEKIKGGLEA